MITRTPLSRRDRKHSAILAAATEVFLANGYPGTSMDEIAAKAGVSKQTVYTHFGNKENLFLAIAEEITSSATEGFGTLPESVDSLAGLRAWLIQYSIDQLTAVLQPEVARVRRLAIAEAIRFPAFARHFYVEGPQVTFDEIAELLERASQAGVVNVPDSAQAARDYNWILLADPVMRSLLLAEDAVPSAAWIVERAEAAVDTLLRSFRRLG